MRDVKEEHTLVLVLSAFLCAKDGFDKRERSEFPSNRRISAYVRVVVLGVLRRTVFWAENPALLNPPGVEISTQVGVDSALRNMV
jgi:hypothetical protein